MSKPGLFISFEGGEGAGKSSLIKRLHETLDQTYQVVCVREPGGSPISEQIRSITHNSQNQLMSAQTEALLMAASRAQLIKEVYLPALDRGAIILADRYIDSTYAYQAYGRGLSLEDMHMLQTFATGGLEPHRTYLLDLPVETGHARRDADARHDRFDEEQNDFFNRVRQGYLELAKTYASRITVIDASPSADQVYATVYDNINQLIQSHPTLAKKGH